MARLKNFFLREKYVFFAFSVTLLSLLIYALAAEIAPFGDNALLSMDMHGQYYPMMVQKLEDFFSVWSWNGSLGFSSIVLIGLIHFFLLIPLNLPYSPFMLLLA